MERITEKAGGASTSNPSISTYNLDTYIKECKHCAHTCRTCAEACVRDAKNLSKVLHVCLDCAKTCESLANALVLQKQGIKNVRQIQIEASIVACRACARSCAEKADSLDCLPICAKETLRCAELITVLLPKSFQPIRDGFFTFLRAIKGK